jgi:hypothetical protein
MEEKNKTGRGGNRPGAGRPKKEPTVVITARIKETLQVKLNRIAESNSITRSDAIEHLIENYKEPTI